MRTPGPSPFRGKQGPSDFPLLSAHIAGDPRRENILLRIASAYEAASRRPPSGRSSPSMPVDCKRRGAQAVRPSGIRFPRNEIQLPSGT